MRKLIVLGGMLAAVVLLYSPVMANDLDVDGDGFSVDQWDCNDNDPTVHPEAFEICRDGIDQNCDGNRQRQRSRLSGVGVQPYQNQWL